MSLEHETDLIDFIIPYGTVELFWVSQNNLPIYNLILALICMSILKIK